MCVQEGERAALAASVEATNLNRAPLFSLAGYSVIELLGSGAFGSVYKVDHCTVRHSALQIYPTVVHSTSVDLTN